jgi:hypothetical protein
LLLEFEILTGGIRREIPALYRIHHEALPGSEIVDVIHVGFGQDVGSGFGFYSPGTSFVDIASSVSRSWHQ